MLEAAGLGRSKVLQLWQLYEKARQAREPAEGPNEAHEDYNPEPSATQERTKGGGVEAFALGVLSRLLSALRMMYEPGSFDDYRLAVQKWVQHGAPRSVRGRGRGALQRRCLL